MHLSRIQITNFRNFSNLDVSLDQHAVIVGENKIGKSNLVHALRLILDPTLPDAQRYLRQEDFWDGLPRPLTKDDAIEVSVEFSDFSDDDELLALLAQHIVCADPMTSRLTYRYQPLETLDQPPTSESDYEFELFGGGRPDNQLAYELRRRIQEHFRIQIGEQHTAEAQPQDAG